MSEKTQSLATALAKAGVSEEIVERVRAADTVEEGIIIAASSGVEQRTIMDALGETDFETTADGQVTFEERGPDVSVQPNIDPRSPSSPFDFDFFKSQMGAAHQNVAEGAMVGGTIGSPHAPIAAMNYGMFDAIANRDASEGGMEEAPGGAVSSAINDIADYTDWQRRIRAGLETGALTYDEWTGQIVSQTGEVVENADLNAILPDIEIPGQPEEELEEEYVPPPLGLYEGFFDGLPPLPFPQEAQLRYMDDDVAQRLDYVRNYTGDNPYAMYQRADIGEDDMALVRSVPYRDGDEIKLFIGMGAEQKGQIQQDLVNAGLLQEGTFLDASDSGLMDGTSQAALRNLLTFSNENGINYNTALSILKGNPMPGPVRPGFVAPQYRPLSWETLAQAAKTEAEAQLHPARQLQDWEIEMLADALKGFHKKDYDAEVRAARAVYDAEGRAASGADATPASVEDVNYVDSFREHFEDRYASEMDRNRRVMQARQNFNLMLNGLGAGRSFVSGGQ